MEAHNVVHGAREKPKGVLVAKVSFHRERKQGDILEGLDVLGTHAALVHAFASERYTFVNAFDEALKTVELKGAQLFDGHVIGGADRMDRGVQIVRELV